MTATGAQLRIGFASIYAWRPHVEHLHYLATLARQAGHECRFLTCDADLAHCYTRELRDLRADWQECLMCRVGGLRSYASEGVSSIGALHEPLLDVPAGASEWAMSSAATLGRFESLADFQSDAFKAQLDRLTPAIATTYRAARNWIARNRLDAVFVFNGRIDATRAVFEAARDADIRVISVERSWFGNGLQLLPDENCLGMGAIDAFVAQWQDKPLTETQARTAASYIARRFAGNNQTEWRAYNADAQQNDWPVQLGSTRRVLLLPGSLNELWGHPDWQSNWPEPTAGYDAVMAHLGLTGADVLLRCHPNWGEKIGKMDGRLAEAYYTQWAQARGITVIPSTDRTSTMGLMAQADAVLLASGTAGLEAGALGKQIIATAPTFYRCADMQTDASSPQALQQLSLLVAQDSAAQQSKALHLRRQTLRFCYTIAHRVAQFTAQVRAQSGARYDYLEGADPQRLSELVQSGQLQPDDAHCADDTAGEDRVIALVQSGDWAALAKPASTSAPSAMPTRHLVRRRWMFRPIDAIRNAMPVGDR